MKPLLKVMLILGSIFATTFILGRLFGILTVDNVKLWLEMASNVAPHWVALTVIALLLLDIFVAVPTLTITILAGFFLGFPLGATAAFFGMSAAALTGYVISWKWGDRAIAYLVKDKADREDLTSTFHENGPVMIMLARAAPMIPEVTACMAGATRMALGKYAFFFTVSTLPYALFASYAGSISSVESPQPAIFASLALYAILWTGWYIFRKKKRRV